MEWDVSTTAVDCGLHRVLEPAGVLPQQAWRLDPDASPRPGETILNVERLNLDAASARQLRTDHSEPAARRRAVLDTVATRGKMHNPSTGSGGMLLGTVREATDSAPLGLVPGQRVATLVSLSLTPLRLTSDLDDWDGESDQVPCRGTAVLFARSIAAVLPDDLDDALALAALDVCGAAALTHRIVRRAYAHLAHPPRVCVLGGAGKSGALALAAAHHAGAGERTALVLTDDEADALHQTGLAEHIARADARDPVAVAAAIPARADVTVVCTDTAGCEHGAILATAAGGSIIYFSMATSFSAAALGAEGLAADVEMIIGNGYAPGHADYALKLARSEPGVRARLSHRERQTAAP